MSMAFPWDSFALLVAAISNLLLAGITWRRRDVAGAKPLLVVLLTAAVWALGVMIRLSMADRSGYFVVDFLVNAMSAIVVPAIFVFAIVYTGREGWLSRRRLLLLAVEPIVLVALLVTALDTPLVVEFRSAIGFWPTLTDQFVFGLGFNSHILYAYVLVTATLGLLGNQVLRTSGGFRKQALVMLVAVIVPFALDVLFNLGIRPFPGSEPAVFGFTITGFAITVGLFFYDFLDLSPVARHALIEGMDDVVIAVDDRGRITDANPEAARVFDVEMDQFLGASAAATIPSYNRLVSETDGGDASADDPTLELAVDDQDRYFTARVTPLEDGRGTLVGRLLVLRDITERREIERRFQALIENATDMITVLDADGTVQYASPSTRSIVGYQPAELVGENAFEYVHPDDREPLLEHFQQILAEPGATATHEYRLRASDGSWRHIESRTRNLLDNDIVSGIVVNARDVTERIEYRTELERQNEQLERFTGVVSHDLRNPINVIDSRVELARRADDVEEQLDSIETAAERMERLIDDLLALARQGQTVEETEPVALATVSEDAWATVETNAASLAVDTDRTVEADPERLQQVFSNLFRNAVEHGSTGSQNSPSSGDAIEHGGTDVIVRVTATTDGFAVSDNGPGIPADEREGVFEWGHTTNPEGTGYGLAIVDRIVSAHGWAIEVGESETGGARFDVTTGGS